MAKTPRKGKQEDTNRVPIPFDDALRKILSAPPQHKVSAKKKEKQPK